MRHVGFCTPRRTKIEAKKKPAISADPSDKSSDISISLSGNHSTGHNNSYVEVNDDGWVRDSDTTTFIRNFLLLCVLAYLEGPQESLQVPRCYTHDGMSRYHVF